MSSLKKILNILEDKWQETITLERGEFLCKKDTIHPYLYYVEEGSLHVYVEDKKEEHTFRFGYTNSIITPLDSFLTGEPTRFFIQAIKKSKMKKICRNRFLEIFNENNDYKQLWIDFLVYLNIGHLIREVDLITYTPKERFDRLKNRSPHIFQEIPNKYIASYLRMKPETLSRLMNDKS